MGEQRAIADYLDTETARIDALITKKRRLITLLEEQQREQIDMVVNGSQPRPATTMPASVGWLDVLPIEWSRSPLKAVFEFRKGVDSQRLTAEYIGANEGCYPVYSGQTANDGLMGMR